MKTDVQTIKDVEKIVESLTPLEYISKANIDIVKIMKNLNRIALSSRTVVKDRDGEIIDLGPNDKMQVVASELILKMADLIKNKSIGDTNFNFNLTVEQREEIRSRISRQFKPLEN